MARHFTLQEREFLYRLRKKGKTNQEIAELMGRDRSTIYREVKRNSGQRGYHPQQAQRLAAERRLTDLPLSLRRSVTFDNGKEFAEHKQLAKSLDVAIYFSAPGRPWQRGSNENFNGLLRQFYPKGTDFSRISHQEVARVETLLNERPRKRLDYRTPSEILAKRSCCN